MASWAELYEDAAERLARPILRLLANPDEWIQRRVEDITITSHRILVFVAIGDTPAKT